MIWHMLSHKFSAMGRLVLFLFGFAGSLLVCMGSTGFYWFQLVLVVGNYLSALLIACLALATWPQVPW